MARRIGIKYCGGCNPTYERTEWVRRLQELTGEGFLFLRHDERRLDGLLIVCGCPKACATENLDLSGVRHLLMVGEGDTESAVRWLRVVARRGGSS